MFRGMTTFKCAQCGNKFVAPDVEYMATAFSMLQRCTKCGSVRTRPVSLFGRLADMKYRVIWERMEKNAEK